jgi:putative ABC transport system ATP-binding protein
LNATRGSTLFLVTHEESLAKRCQRVVRLAGGRIVGDEQNTPHAEPVEA